MHATHKIRIKILPAVRRIESDASMHYAEIYAAPRTHAKFLLDPRYATHKYVRDSSLFQGQVQIKHYSFPLFYVPIYVGSMNACLIIWWFV